MFQKFDGFLKTGGQRAAFRVSWGQPPAGRPSEGQLISEVRCSIFASLQSERTGKGMVNIWDPVGINMCQTFAFSEIDLLRYFPA